MSQVKQAGTAGAYVRAGVMMAVMAAPGAAHAQGPPYTFQTIQYPNAVTTEPYGINNSGVVVGTFVDQSGIHHGFKYEGGTYSLIDFPGSTQTWALGINNLGQIVGSHSLNGPDGPWHSFVLDNGNYVQFDVPGWESDARGINAAGSIVGVYNAGGILPTHGFTRTPDDTYTTLDHPGALYTFLWGINDAGKISGSYINDNDPTYTSHGFVYAGGTFMKIDYPGARATSVIGINNLDDVVGSHIQNNGAHGYIHSQGRFRSFDMPGATSTRAIAINDSREIVGSYFSSQCASGCGFIARPQSGLPRCTQSYHLSYAPGTLTFNFATLATSVPTTWEAWLIVSGSPYKLWSIPLGVVPQTGPFTIPLALPPLGRVVGLSGLSVAGSGMICADYSATDTKP